jgi:hypothetical protein
MEFLEGLGGYQLGLRAARAQLGVRESFYAGDSEVLGLKTCQTGITC